MQNREVTVIPNQEVRGSASVGEKFDSLNKRRDGLSTQNSDNYYSLPPVNHRTVPTCTPQQTYTSSADFHTQREVSQNGNYYLQPNTGTTNPNPQSH